MKARIPPGPVQPVPRRRAARRRERVFSGAPAGDPAPNRNFANVNGEFERP
eukprot:COSAG02_NODE_7219_length_3112_cov_17.585463_2_plen_51_part_00